MVILLLEDGCINYSSYRFHLNYSRGKVAERPFQFRPQAGEF